ncbi:MAG: citrate transporter [Oscillospiraceae bacterium]|nr:citrate transporter [Oscillospiraceae bacterium]MBR5422901.1 citrate transporter [Clostridia bacterium]
MQKILRFIKKEPMLPVAVLAAAVSLLITPPTKALLTRIDWRTLGTLFMMLTVLEGFKQENIFRPLLRLTGRIGTMAGLSLFLVFGVFFSSMFVTNDVSLIVFVPLTILLMRAADKEWAILPVISMENIAAVRGSLLTPFGSPQNLFIYGQSGVSAWRFVKFMFPIWILSGALLVCFVLFLYRKDLKQKTGLGKTDVAGEWLPRRRGQRIVYLCLFLLVLGVIVTRTRFWYVAVAVVALAVLAADRKLLLKTDYVLLVTFFCFFVFSSSVAANETVAAFLQKVMAGREYIGSILLSQLISNVPASIVLYPFAKNVGALLYGLDSAGLVSLIGSLASVINYRIYVRAYPGRGGAFLKTFTLISLAFFAIVAVPGYLISLAGM